MLSTGARKLWMTTVGTSSRRYRLLWAIWAVTDLKRAMISKFTKKGIKSALGRLGFNLGKDIDAKTNIYIKGNWLHEFGGSYKATLYDRTGGDHVTIEQSYNDTWFEYGVGAAIQTGKTIIFILI